MDWLTLFLATKDGPLLALVALLVTAFGLGAIGTWAATQISATLSFRQNRAQALLEHKMRMEEARTLEGSIAILLADDAMAQKLRDQLTDSMLRAQGLLPAAEPEKPKKGRRRAE